MSIFPPTWRILLTLTVLIAPLSAQPLGQARKYSVHAPQPGDRWELKWQGTVTLEDGTQDFPAKGSEIYWVTDASSQSSKTRSERLVLRHYEDRVSRNDESKLRAFVLAAGSDLIRVLALGGQRTLRADTKTGSITRSQKVISDDPYPAYVWTGLVYKGETKYEDGSVDRWEEVYGKAEQVEVSAGTFTCLSFTQNASSGSATYHRKGYYCPAIDHFVKFTETVSAPEGKTTKTFQLVSTNVEH